MSIDYDDFDPPAQPITLQQSTAMPMKQLDELPDANSTKLEPSAVNQLQTIVQNAGLGPVNGLQLRQQYDSFFSEALGIQMVSANIKDPEVARRTRLSMKNVRVAAEKKRVELKEDSLRRGKTIDALFNVIKNIAEPVEAKLFELETAEERKVAQARAAKAESYAAALRPYGVDTQFIDLANMDDTEFQKLLINSKAGYELRVAQQKVAEEQRLAAEKAKREENEKLRAENLRIKAEADAAAAKARAEFDAAQKAGREAYEKQKAEFEKAEAEKRKLKAEKMAAEKAEADRIAAEAEAASKRAAAPDREKLVALRDAFNAIQFPRLTSAKGEWAAEDVQEAFMTFIAAINQQIEKLS